MNDAAADQHGSRPTRRTRGTGGWLYLGLLTVVAVALVVAAVAFDGGGGPRRTLPGVVEPVALVLRVQGPAVTLEGRVPAAAVRDGLVELAGARYGPPDVDDQLVVDGRTTLDGGDVAVAGWTAVDGPDPLGLQADIAAAFLLRAGPVQLDVMGDADDGGPSVAMVPAEQDPSPPPARGPARQTAGSGGLPGRPESGGNTGWPASHQRRSDSHG